MSSEQFSVVLLFVEYEEDGDGVIIYDICEIMQELRIIRHNDDNSTYMSHAIYLLTARPPRGN